MKKELTVGQYRALIAYISFWKDWPGCNLQQAKKDIGINCDNEIIKKELFKAGWVYDEQVGFIKFDG